MEDPSNMTEPSTNGIDAPETNGSSAENTTTAPGLSAEEIALYDRQIRLWGAQAQERIRSAKILLISLRALGTEIAKNLTLAGISALTIIDEDPVQEEDLGAQFFLRESDVGKPRAQAAIPHIQELNPLVKVTSGGSLADLLTKGGEYYLPYDIIIICDHDFLTASAINTVARMFSKPTYIAGIHGFYGFIFADLFAHDFVIERAKSNVPTTIGPESLTRQVLSVTTRQESSGKTTEMVKKSEVYCPLILANSSPLPFEILNNRRKLKNVPPLLPCLRALWDFQRSHARLPGLTQQDLAEFTTLATIKSRELQLPAETLRSDFLRSFMQNIGSEITPTAAFVGGRLSEDVINVLGKREQPIQNFALFDGEGLEGKIYCLYSPPPEIAMLAAAAGVADMGFGMPMDMSGGMGMPMGAGMDMGVVGNGDMQGMQMQMQMGMGNSEQQIPQVQVEGSGPTSAPVGGEGNAATAESNGENAAS